MHKLLFEQETFPQTASGLWLHTKKVEGQEERAKVLDYVEGDKVFPVLNKDEFARGGGDAISAAYRANEASQSAEAAAKAARAAISDIVRIIATATSAAAEATEAVHDATEALDAVNASIITDISYTESTEPGGINVLHITTGDGIVRNYNIRNASAPEYDDVPTEGSGNPVSSAGVYDAIANKADKIDIVYSIPTGGMLPNVFYDLGTLTSDVELKLAAAADDTIYNEWMCQFTTGSPAPSITWDAAITGWIGGSEPELEDSVTYQVSVVNGLAVIGEFGND